MPQPIRAVSTFLFLAVIAEQASAQLVRSEDELQKIAEASLVEFLHNRENVCQAYKVAISAELRATRPSHDLPIMRDDVFLIAESTPEQVRFFSAGLFRLDEAGASRTRFWQASLHTRDGWYRRVSSKRPGDRTGGVVEVTDDGPKPLIPSFDPIYMTVGQTGSWAGGGLGGGYELTLLRSKLTKAEQDEKGNVVGYWKFEGNSPVMLQLTFGEDSGRMPVRAIWRYFADPTRSDQDSALNPPSDISVSSWKKIGDMWVPDFVHKQTIYRNDPVGNQDDWRGRYCWKLGEDAINALPSRSDPDWEAAFIGDVVTGDYELMCTEAESK